MFRPRMVLLFSLEGAALVGLYLLHYPFVRATVFDPSATFQYFVPLMVPMIAFMFERVKRVREANFFQHGVDYLVFGLGSELCRPDENFTAPLNGSRIRYRERLRSRCGKNHIPRMSRRCATAKARTRRPANKNETTARGRGEEPPQSFVP